jgi:primosomal protein N' (replication factor Y)
LTLGETLYRMDSDSMQRADQFHQVLSDFQRGDIRVLLGTQMIAKGLDVPGVRLVGVVDADTALHLPDFRAAERTMQLVAQVTGRCGRGAASGTAVIQTLDPDASSIAMAASGDVESFLEMELAQRRDAALPPVTRMARVIARNEHLATCEATIEQVAATLRVLAPEGVDVLGPMPCPLARIRNQHRLEILLTAPTAEVLQRWLHDALQAQALGDPSLVIDVDPVALR